MTGLAEPSGQAPPHQQENPEPAVYCSRAVFLFESYKYTAVSYKYSARSEMAEILLYPWMALMTLVSALMILIVADNVFQIVRELINQRDSNKN